MASSDARDLCPGNRVSKAGRLLAWVMYCMPYDGWATCVACKKYCTPKWVTLQADTIAEAWPYAPNPYMVSTTVRPYG